MVSPKFISLMTQEHMQVGTTKEFALLLFFIGIAGKTDILINGNIKLSKNEEMKMHSSVINFHKNVCNA